MDRAGGTVFEVVLAGVVSTAVGMGFGRFVFTPLLPAMMTGLGMSASDAGLIASANFLGYLIGAFAAAGGWAQGRERAVLLSALAANAVLLAAMGVDSGLAGFVAIRLAAGVASAFIFVFTTSLSYSHLLRLGRPELRSVFMSGVGLGIALSSIMTGLLHQAGAGWSAGWFGSAVVALIGLVVAALFIAQPEGSSAKVREPAIEWSPALVRIALAYGIFGFGYIVTSTFLVAIVRQSGAAPVFEALVWCLTGLSVVLSFPLWLRVARHVGMVTIFVLGCLLEAAGVLASVTIGGVTGPILAGILLGGTFVIATAMGLQIGNELARNAPRRVVAVMTALFGIGQIIGPAFAGYMADRTGSFFLPSLVAAAALVVCAVLGWDAGRLSPSGRSRPDSAGS
jgi:predicted MFS family arabinose efflux permease